MKLIDRIDRSPAFAASGKGGGNTVTFAVLRDADSVTLLSSNGDETVLPSANPAEAGVMSAADKSKLDGVEPGATGDQTGAEIVAAIDMELGGTAWQAGGEGVATNLSLDISEDMVILQSDTGADAVLTAATATAAGVLAAADKAKLDGIEPGAQVNPDAAAIKAAYESNADTNAFTDAERAKLAAIEPGATGDQTGAEIVAAINAELGGTAWQDGGTGGTNLAFTRDASSLTVTSDTGSDAVLPAASATEAGVMSAADKAKLDGLGSGGQAGGDMAAAVYDPQGVAGDAFDRANHRGAQAIGTITGLQAALDGKAPSSHGHAAGDIASGTLAHERGGLEADVSAYNGLVKISGGITSQAVPGTDYAAATHSHTQSQVTGLRTTDSPQFAAINLGHATDTTLARSAAGQVTIEGIQVLTASNAATVTNKSIDAAQLTGTVSVSRFNGGTGASASTFLRGDGTWAAPAGGTGTGDVTKDGTPADNQVAVWTGDGTVEGDADLTFDGTRLTVSNGTTPAASWPRANSKFEVYSDGSDLDVLFGTASATAVHRNIFNFARSRGANAANPAAVANADYLGSIQGRGFDGTNSQIGARLDFQVDGAVSAGAVPTSFAVSTGQSLGSLSVRFKIGSGGAITFNNAYTFPTSIGTSGQVLRVPASGTTLEWGTASSGSGDVTKVGTPVANRMAYWTGDGTLGHEAGFTYDASTDTLTVTRIVIGGVTFDGQNQLTDPNADRLMGWDDSAGTTAYFAPTGGLEISGTDLRMTANQRTTAIEFVIDGGGAAITAGTKGFIQVPFACTIKAARLLADRAGSIIVDVWKDSYANYPPTDADSITGATPPTISAAAKSENTGLTGWTTSIAAGDILGFNVDSASTVTRVTVVLTVEVS